MSAAREGRAREGARTRSFSWEDPALAGAAAAGEGLGLSGLERIQALLDGTLPPPPIASALGMEPVEVEEGRVLFALQPAEWMYNPLGSVHGGIAATLLDTCMGCAVQTMLASGSSYTTSDLQVRYVRALHADSGRVLAEGSVVHLGRRTATAEGRLFRERDAALVAHASTGCVILG